MSSNTRLEQHNLAVTDKTNSESTPQYWATGEPFFAQPRHGNTAKFYVSGRDLMTDVAVAIKSARKFLMFVDWQMDFDVELEGRGDPNHPGRFSELLANQLDKEPQLEVKILLYDSAESPAYTHENEVRKNLERLNKKGELRKRVQVVVQAPNTGRGFENIGFSHHQKLIVVDGVTAFIGGMDVTYGRWDTGNFDVVADPVVHRINDMYNPGLIRGRPLTSKELLLTKTNLGKPLPAGSRNKPGFAEPYYLLSILVARLKVLWDQGRTLEEILIFLGKADVENGLRDLLIKKLKEFKEKLKKAAAVYRAYEAKKAKGRAEMQQGQVIDGAGTWISAHVDLGKMALNRVGDKLTAMRKELGYAWDAAVDDVSAKIDDAKYYANDPEQLIADAKKSWDEIKALPDYFTVLECLEEGSQPRMPWQDVHARIQGAAVFDIFKNIARRWNVSFQSKDNAGATALDAGWLQRQGGLPIFGNLQTPDGQGVSVQVVRSMSLPWLQQEWQNANNKAITLDFQPGTPEYAKQLARHSKLTGHMHGIEQAMLNAIQNASAYVYIETQFFISDCGKSRKDESSPAKNTISTAIAARISRAIASGKGFHVYVVLPVHPEGNLNAPAVAKQHYWILQTIKQGKKSLLRQISTTIARQKKGNQLAAVTDAEVQQVLDGGEWKAYVSFLNLRNWGMTALFERKPSDDEVNGGDRILSKMRGQFVITEQIYVHSKLLIADDAVVIIGSANTNDRSLLGNGDSEIAVVIRDNACQRNVDLGNGEPVTTRKFAKEMRTALWQKHFGFDIKPQEYMRADRAGEANDASALGAQKLPYPPRRKAEQWPAGLDPAKPASVATIMAVQRAARANADIYEKVFQHTPRDSMKKFGDTEACWPKRLSKSGLALKPVKWASMVAAAATLEPDFYQSGPKAEVVVPDFGAEPPALKPEYMKGAPAGVEIKYQGKVHDLSAASAALAGLTGFFVSMPLDFGQDERDVWLSGNKGNFLIADGQTDVPRGDRQEGLLAEASSPSADQSGTRQS